jgi:hypothetical protein
LLDNGEGDVLIYKSIEKGWSWASDSGDYFYIIIITPEHMSGTGEISIGGPKGAKVFYLTGQPPIKAPCFKYSTSGKIKYTTITDSSSDVGKMFFSKLGISDGMIAEISTNFTVSATDYGPAEWCSPCNFDAYLIVHRVSSAFINDKARK